jgi:hypothetical protein
MIPLSVHTYMAGYIKTDSSSEVSNEYDNGSTKQKSSRILQG